MRAKVKAVKVLVQAMGVIKAFKKIKDGMRLFVEAVRVLAEFLLKGKYRP